MDISGWLRWRLNRSARRRARAVLRGYRKLQASPDPGLVARFNEQITRLPLGTQGSACSSLIFEPNSAVELAARQFLIARCAGLPLNAAILRTLGDPRAHVAAPIPSPWVRVMRENGIRVAGARCRTLFAGFVGKRFLVGVAQIGRILLLRRSASRAARGVAYAHFVDVGPTNLPRKDSARSYDLVSWYLAWQGRAVGLTEVWQHRVPLPAPRRVGDVTLRAVKHAIPALDPRAKLSFAAWGVRAVAAAAWGAVRGRWAAPVLLSDATWAKQTALLPDDLVASEYLFSLSSSVYRPLWTYVAERRGSAITLFNYAASFHDFKTDRQPPHGELGYESMSWPRMLVWTDRYAEYARARLPHVRAVELVPPLWFADSDDAIPETPRPCVAVFDVTPNRATRMAMGAPAVPYRTFDVGREFLEHIYEVLQSLGYDLLWKRKRSFAPVHDRRYVRFSSEFAARPGVVDVPPNVSAFRVVEASAAVISTPFTSTAFIASGMGRPSVFFDPMEWLRRDDPAAQGIPLVYTRRDLREWLQRSRPAADALKMAAS